MRKAATTLIALVGALVYYTVWGEDPQTSACVRQVNQIETAYRSSVPKAQSRRAIEKTLARARAWCGDGRIQDANNAMDVAAVLCVAQKGCQPLLDEAERRRQGSR